MKKNNQSVYFFSRLIIGKPDCGSMQPWSIYHYHNSSDRLRLLPNGVLRHYSDHLEPGERQLADMDSVSFHYDYASGKYCLDKVYSLLNSHIHNTKRNITNFRKWLMEKYLNLQEFVHQIMNKNGCQRMNF